MRTQFSTGCSQNTLDQIKNLVEKCGYSQREIFTLAIEQFYASKIKYDLVRPEIGDSIRFKWGETGTVIQDGAFKSLINRRGIQPGTNEQDWFNNDEFQVIKRYIDTENARPLLDGRNQR